MKISKFAQQNGISNDTIRHYMKLGLISPIKDGGQYDFDENCQKNFDHIIKLKNMGFSLSEIKTILLYDKVGRLTQYSEISDYRSLYLDKLADLDKELLRLNHAKNTIEEYILTLKSPEQFNHQFGIPLKDMSLLQCAVCQKPLLVKDGTIEGDSVISGQLECRCGESYSIINGILTSSARSNSNEILSGLEFVGDYIKHTSEDYLNNISRALEFFDSIVEHIDLENKTIIEAGTGWGVFIRYIYDKLPESMTYIAVDKSYEQLLLLKETLEKVPMKKNVLFVCADFESLPLKHHSSDVLIDATGSTSYNFDTDEWLLNTMKPYLKEEYELLAGYMLFSKFNLKSDIPIHLRKYYDMNLLEEHLKENKIEILRSALYDQVEESGPYDSYFNDGEVVFTRCIHGKHRKPK